MKVLLYPGRLLEVKSGRNSGRTFDLLAKAVLATKDYSTVVFLTACDGEAKRLGRDVALICEHFGIEFRRCRDYHHFAVGDSELVAMSAHYQGRGCRAHFVIDHSCSELLSGSQYDEMLACVQHAHAGEWPPIGARNPSVQFTVTN